MQVLEREPFNMKASRGGGGANRRLEALIRKESAEESLKTRQSSGNVSGNASNVQEFDPWDEKYQPKSLETHFVHKKRVEEVEFWLKEKLSRNKASICLLTGPAGCGKTATICLLASQNECTVKEWINPMSLTEFNPNLEYAGDFVVRSQLDLFSDFIIRSSQYSALPLKGVVAKAKKLILVEDFPNMLYRQPSVFHELLRNYAKMGTCPLIFIVADSSSDGNVNKLFPKSTLAELAISQFSFNPIPPSYIVKFLCTIASQENLNVDKSLLEDIAVASAGDIRWAVNHLQFKTQLTEKSLFKRPMTNLKRSKTKTGTTSKVAKRDERDESLFLFRALGKVLYSKRDTTVTSEVENELRGPLIAMRRLHPLQEIPESVGNKMEVAPETFFNFLHQNYVSFFASMEDVAKASSFLADSAAIFSQWIFDDSTAKNFKNRDTREELGLSISIRGLMHSNNNRVASSWKPLKKPILSEVNAAVRKTVESGRELFSKTTPLTQHFYPEMVDAYAKLLPSFLSLDQIAFLKNLKSNTSQIKNFSAALSENEAIDMDVEISEHLIHEKLQAKASMVVGEMKLAVPIVEAEEEFKIEEYD